MVKNTDLAICNSKDIQKYINDQYKTYNPITTFMHMVQRWESCFDVELSNIV
ncbi:DUF1972 domain-containing protein [Bacillus sp. ISL-40]|uniref:hypothetical protein n=1 Tax=unclassified Bacillus (in: firmicutes) TaxID=185979 RepID=UPI001C1B32D1|nr:DUF1972 domain-containing protein [Bacillus sp. ISL-40]